MHLTRRKFDRSLSQIREKFEQVKALDGTGQDGTPAGDGYVEIRDEFESKGHAQFDEAGKPISFDYEEWESDGFGDDTNRQEVHSYSIKMHESGYHYYYSEVSSDDGELWSPGVRIAVDPKTHEPVGTFSIKTHPHSVIPLPEEV